MNPVQIVAQKLTCLFETNKLFLILNTIIKLKDKRGLTCGWAGFTTANEEVVLCIELYTAMVPGNHLASFLPLLRRLRDTGSDSTWLLEIRGFRKHWANACSNVHFQEAYAQVVDKLFGQPAQKHCDELGWTLEIGFAALFDALAQEGNEQDDDGVPKLIERSKKHWPTPGPSEIEQIGALLEERRRTLEHSYDPDTRADWKESVPRVDALIGLLHTNPHLTMPLHVVCSDWNVILN